jgi:hypothetical protein
MNPFNISELFAAAWKNPKLNKPVTFGSYAEARYLRAKARISKRKAKR